MSEIRPGRRRDRIAEGLFAGVLLAGADWVVAGVFRTPLSIVLLSFVCFAVGGLIAGLIGALLNRRGLALGLAMGGALTVHGLSIVSKTLGADEPEYLRNSISLACLLLAAHHAVFAGLAFNRAHSKPLTAGFGALLSAVGLSAASLIFLVGPIVNVILAQLCAIPFSIAAFALVRRHASLSVVAALVAMVASAIPVAVLDREPARRFPPTGTEVVARPDAPNIVLILIDTLRADHLGSETSPTPILDDLASGGANFKQAISSASWTLPATSSILTSLYPSQHGAVMATTSLSGEVETLAEVFHAAGYETAAFTGGAFVSPAFGLDQGFDYFDHLAEFNFRPFRIHIPLAWRVAKNRYLAFRPLLRHVNEFGGMGAVNRRVRDWLRLRSKKRPFFLLVHSYQVHDYYIYHPGPDDEVRESLGPLSPAFAGRLSVHPSELLTASQADIDWFHGIYQNRIRFVDSEIGILMAELKAHLGEAALFAAMTSDHGEGFDATLKRVHHGDRLHDDLLRVPLLLSAPGQIAPGTRIEHQVRTIDLMPTLIDLAGLSIPSGLAGRSLLESLQSGTNWPETAFGEEIHAERRQLAVRTGDWKLIRKTDSPGADEIYDLAADPRESDSATRPPPAALLEQLENFRKQFPERDIQQSAIDPATLDHLRALGYIE